MKDDNLYLIHILECIEKIESYTRDGREAFMSTPVLQDAVIRNCEIIGEAAKRVSDKLRQAHPDVPWRRVAGFRDVLIHNYPGLDLEEIWSVASIHLPELKRRIEEIVRR